MATLTTYRQNAYRAINQFQYATATATAGSTLTSLELALSPFKSTLAQSALYRDWWIFRPNAAAATDKVRVCATYTPATGMLDGDNPWGAAPYAAGVGEAVELIGCGIEPLTDMTQLVNDALLRCFVVTDFTVAPIALATRHAITTQAWLTDEDWVLQVGYLASGQSREQVDPFANVVHGEPSKQDGVVYLNHYARSFNATDTLYVKALKPAYYHCRATSGGAYGDRSGLSAEAHEAEPHEKWVAAAVKMLAWEQLAAQLASGDQARAERELAKAATVFSDMRAQYLTVPPKTFRRQRSWGPSQGRGRVVGWMAS